MALRGSATLSLASFSSRGRRGYARIKDNHNPDDLSRGEAKRASRDGDDLDHNTFDSDNSNAGTNLVHPDDDDDVPDLDYEPTFDESMENTAEDRDFHLLEGDDDIVESVDPSGYLDMVKQEYLTDDESNATSEDSDTTSVIDDLAQEGPSMMCLDEDSLQQLARLGDKTGQNLSELNKYIRRELEVDGFVEEMKGFSEQVVANGLNNIDKMKDLSDEVVTFGLNFEKFAIPQLFTCLSRSGWVRDQTPRLESFVSESFVSEDSDDSYTKESVHSDPSKEDSHLKSSSKDASCKKPPAKTSAMGERSGQAFGSSFFVDSSYLFSAQFAPPQEENNLPSLSATLKVSSCDDLVQSVSPKEESCLPLYSSKIEDEEDWMEIQSIKDSAQPPPFHELSHQAEYSSFFLDSRHQDSVQLVPPQKESKQPSFLTGWKSAAQIAPPQEENNLPSLSATLKVSSCDDLVQSVSPKEESYLPSYSSNIEDEEEGMEILSLEESAQPHPFHELSHQAECSSFFLDSRHQDSVQLVPPQKESKLPSFLTGWKSSAKLAPAQEESNLPLGSSSDDLVQLVSPKEENYLPLYSSKSEDEEEGMEIQSLEESAQPHLFHELSHQAECSSFFLDSRHQDSAQSVPPQKESKLSSFFTGWKDSAQLATHQGESNLPLLTSTLKGSSCDDLVQSVSPIKESCLPLCSTIKYEEEGMEILNTKESAQPPAFNELSHQAPCSSFYVDQSCKDSAQSVSLQEESNLSSVLTSLKDSSCGDWVQSVSPKEERCLPSCFPYIECKEQETEIPNIEEPAQPPLLNELSRQPSCSSFFLDSDCEDLVHLDSPQEDNILPSFSASVKGSSCDDSAQSVSPKEESFLPSCFSSIEDVEEGMEIPYISCTGTHNTDNSDKAYNADNAGNTDNTGSGSEREPITAARTRTAEMKERQTLLSKLLFGGQRKDSAKVAPAPVATPAPRLTNGSYASRVGPEVIRIQLMDGSMATISRDAVTRLAKCHWV
jgi:hypothetical protein